MTTRSEFLSAGVAAAAIPALVAASPAPSPSPEPSFPPLHFDVAAFDAALDVPAAHKHLFASAKVNGGLILDSVRSTLDAYGTLGISVKDVQPAVVFYHFSSPLGFDDLIWNQYVIQVMSKNGKSGELSKDLASVYDGKSHGNPCLHKTGKEFDTSIESLIADANTRFFVCNNATMYMAGFFAKQLKLDRLTVYATMAAHLVPNATIVPAGVWAIHAVQERHYTYLQATL
jgi:intracellular sulfur oxidation DsrE/DsrF family protein